MLGPVVMGFGEPNTWKPPLSDVPHTGWFVPHTPWVSLSIEKQVVCKGIRRALQTFGNTKLLLFSTIYCTVEQLAPLPT